MTQRIYTEIQAKSMKLPAHQKPVNPEQLPLSYRDFSQVQYFHPASDYTAYLGEAFEAKESILPAPLINTLAALEEEDSLKIVLQWHMANKDFWQLIEKSPPK